MSPADGGDDQEDGPMEDGALPLACTQSMSGWCGQLHRHDRCYFNHPGGIAAARAGTYGERDGHQWICACPCHDTHDYPPCPHPDHRGERRPLVRVDRDVQPTLF